MPEIKKVNVFGLRLMYILTMIIAGISGLGLMFISGFTQWIFGVTCSPIISGLVGSLFISFALLSVLGLRNPVKLSPILVMQLVYKAIWILIVVLPHLISGKISTDIIPIAGIFILVIIGDLIVIPFHQIIQNIGENFKG